MRRNILHVLFNLLYHQFAWSYDLVAWLISAGHWNSWIKAVLPYLEGPLILELGHGPGHLLVALAQRGRKTIGLDSSLQMSRLASLKTAEVAVAVELISGYAQFIPFKAASFSQIVATFPSDSILSPETFLEVYRTLKPGGSFILLPTAWISDQGFLIKISNILLHYPQKHDSTSQLENNQFLLNNLTSSGFNVSSWYEPINHHGKSSTVWIIRAQKPT